MKKLMIAVTLVAAVAAHGVEKTAEADAQKAGSVNPVSRSGGYLVKPGTGKGTVTIINNQNKVGRQDLVAATEAIRKDARFRFDIQEETKPVFAGSSGVLDLTSLMAAKGAKILVAVIDDARCPNLLVSPENGWAVVNVARLGEGLSKDGAKAKFIPLRTRQEILRAFSLAAGAGGTQFPGNVLAVNTLKELDYCGEFLPMDAIQRIIRNLKNKGIEPEYGATYRRACMEGWAPAPTNDVQKQIWERSKNFSKKKK